jgi:hypothetical protein
MKSPNKLGFEHPISVFSIDTDTFDNVRYDLELHLLLEACRRDTL